MALLQIEAPASQDGAKMILTAEQEKNCKVLYKKTPDGYIFEGLYDPEIGDEGYADGIVAVPLRSAYGGTKQLAADTSVWNVTGSTGDTWKGKAAIWIDVWKNQFPGKTTKCYVAGSAGITCNSIIYGGHMVDTVETNPDYGTDGKVFIIPICNAHNNHSNTKEMKVSELVDALILDKYHQVSDL